MPYRFCKNLEVNHLFKMEIWKVAPLLPSSPRYLDETMIKWEKSLIISQGQQRGQEGRDRVVQWLSFLVVRKEGEEDEGLGLSFLGEIQRRLVCWGKRK